MADAKNLDNYYNNIAEIYDTTRSLPPTIEQQVTEFILHQVNATPQTTFLELGIGTGLIAIPIVQKGYSYTGIDISQEMMTQIQRKLGTVPDHLTLIQADASKFSVEAHSFDVILMRHFIHIISDWQLMLSEIRRVLKSGGVYLYCESPWTPHQKEFEKQWETILQQQPGYQMPSFESGDRATQATVINWLTAQGAVVETAIAAQWQVEETVGDRLALYETRDHGSCWSVSGAEFPKVMQQFRNWCRQHYGSEDVIISSEATFTIVSARWS